MTDRLFIDQDGDACLEPHDREDNLVALPARDDDGNILNPAAWVEMVRRFNHIADHGEIIPFTRIGEVKTIPMEGYDD